MNQRAAPGPIRVGILHSLSGTMATSERPVADVTLMAIREINRRGGLLGRRVVPVLVDGRSDPKIFAREAERLITDEKVAVVFGCWTSASRKAVKPVFEKRHNLLFYPVQYEGFEESHNIVYTGATPNQQIIPAIRWSSRHLGKRLYLVGSDYIFPRMANWIIRREARILGIEIVGESYIPLGSSRVGEIVRKIIQSDANVVINTINGDSNIAFFQAMRNVGHGRKKIPSMSFSIDENEVRKIQETIDISGDYVAWNYFQSLRSDENRRFVEAYRADYGQDAILSDPMEAAYIGVQLWAQTVRVLGTTEVHAVRHALKTLSYRAPEGIVSIDAENYHTWKTVRIGRIRSDSQFDVVWDSVIPVRPEPYPLRISKSEADRELRRLFGGWGGHWSLQTGKER